MYLVAVLFAAFVCFSCSDDDDKDDEELTGVWNYKSADDVYLEFEYKDENITISEEMLELIPEELLNKIPDNIKELILKGGIPVTIAKPLLASYAGQQMAKYFRGINFVSDTELKILITAGDKDQEISTTYKVQGTVLQVSTQSDDFKKITKNMIPEAMASIDLNYFFKNGKLTLYLGTTYVKTIISMLPTILVATGTITPEEMVKIKPSIDNISSKITKLEIGATLKR